MSCNKVKGFKYAADKNTDSSSVPISNIWFQYNSDISKRLKYYTGQMDLIPEEENGVREIEETNKYADGDQSIPNSGEKKILDDIKNKKVLFRDYKKTQPQMESTAKTVDGSEVQNNQFKKSEPEIVKLEQESSGDVQNGMREKVQTVNESKIEDNKAVEKLLKNRENLNSEIMEKNEMNADMKTSIKDQETSEEKEVAEKEGSPKLDIANATAANMPNVNKKLFKEQSESLLLLTSENLENNRQITRSRSQVAHSQELTRRELLEKLEQARIQRLISLNEVKKRILFRRQHLQNIINEALAVKNQRARRKIELETQNM